MYSQTRENKINELEEVIKKMQEENEKLKDQVKNKGLTVNNLRKLLGVTGYQDKLDQLVNTTQNTYEIKIKLLEEKISTLAKQKIQELTTKLKNFKPAQSNKGEIEELQNTKQQLEVELSSLKNELKKKQEEVESLKEFSEKLKTDLQARESHVKELEIKIQSIQKESNEALAKLQSEIEQKNAQIAELEKKLDRLQQSQDENNSVSEKLAEAQKNYQTLEKEFNYLHAEHKEKLALISELTNKIKDMEEFHKGVNASLQATIEQHKQEIDSLKKSLEEAKAIAKKFENTEAINIKLTQEVSELKKHLEEKELNIKKLGEELVKINEEIQNSMSGSTMKLATDMLGTFGNSSVLFF
jgi:Chromosome segregation ATPases